MADDFDESAAQPVGEVIAQLREQLGIPGTESTSDIKDDKQAAGGENDETVKSETEHKSDNDDVEEKDETAGDDKDELSGKDKAPVRSAGLNKILEKYGFDEEKFADGWFALQNSLSQTVKRLESLEDKLDKQAGSNEPHPDIVKLNTELEELTEDIKENRAEQTELVAKGEKIRAEISKLTGRKEATEDGPAKDALDSKIDILKERLESHAAKWKDIDRDNKKLLRKTQQIDGRRKEVEADLVAQREEGRKQSVSNEQWRATQNFRYSTAVKELAKIYEMTPGQHERIGKLIKADLKQFVDNNPDGDPIDLVKFVAARAKVHTAEFNIKSRFVKTGTDKKDVAKSGNGQRAGGAVTPTPRAKHTPVAQEKAAEDAQAARLHARRTLGTA